MSNPSFDEKKAVNDPSVASKESPSASTCDGTIVSLTGNKLVMSNKQGEQSTHTLAKDAKVTLDGAVCMPDRLKAGSRIRVTTKPDDRSQATAIDALAERAEFATTRS